MTFHKTGDPDEVHPPIAVCSFCIKPSGDCPFPGVPRQVDSR